MHRASRRSAWNGPRFLGCSYKVEADRKVKGPVDFFSAGPIGDGSDRGDGLLGHELLHHGLDQLRGSVLGPTEAFFEIGTPSQ